MIKRFFLLIVFSFFVTSSLAYASQKTIEQRISDLDKEITKSEDVVVATVREQISGLRTDLTKEKTEIAAKITGLQQNLDIVNAAVKDKTPPPEIQKQIDGLNKEIAALQAKEIDFNLTKVKIDEIEGKLNSVEKKKLISDVKVKHTFPFSPSYIGSAIPDIISTFYFTITEPYLWFSNQISNRKYEMLPTLIYFGATIFLAFFGVVVVKRILLKHLNYRSDTEEEPSYTSKLIVAFIEAVSNGIFPATILGIIYYWFMVYAHGIEGVLSAIILGGVSIIIALVLIHSIAQAIFSPNMINWRLTTLNRLQTKKVYRIIISLGFVFGFHIFFFNILTQIEANEQSRVLFTVVMNIIEAILSFMLLRHDLWERETEKDQFAETSDILPKSKKKRLNLWRLARSIMSFVIIISGFASFLGYVGFGDFIIKRILYSTAVASLVIVLRSFFYEITLLFINSEYANTTLGIPQKRLKVLRFWLILILNITLFCLATYVILPLWGVPQTDVVNTGKALATGFSIGGVTISLLNIFMAIVVFIVIAKIFSWTQGWLKGKIFPATDMESSLQDSLSAGIGYVGMIMGFLVSVSVLGINFTNLAIVAGALSVGIGFGLQNIVNNFVSGIIILLERPIKVGDWIIINGNEGVVSRISFRATEIETFNKASILIPNAEIISNVLLNWTHNNHYGRVDIPVTVSYKSEIEYIKDILLSIASQNAKVLFVPQPQVIFVGIDEDSLKFELRVFISDINDSVTVGSDLRYNVVKKFKEENIEIPYRQQIMHIRTNDGHGEEVFSQKTAKKDKKIELDE